MFVTETNDSWQRLRVYKCEPRPRTNLFSGYFPVGHLKQPPPSWGSTFHSTLCVGLFACGWMHAFYSSVYIMFMARSKQNNASPALLPTITH